MSARRPLVIAPPPTRGRLAARVIAAALLALAALGPADARAAEASPRPLAAHGSAEQAYATGLPPHARATLTRADGRVVGRARADAQGGVLFRDVPPGGGDRIAAAGRRSGPLRIESDRPAPPSTAIYDQVLHPGYGYLTVRDGTRLAIDVHLPHPVAAPALLADGGRIPENASLVRVRGPYPTLVEYSGYGYADPRGPVNGIAQLANLLGFAVVDVSMRGTGCSGGAYDYFEPNQSLDGYDAIETVARQPWVLGHRVGMLGISYGGISQLFTAATDPPALAAITPLSPIDSTITTLYPGGVLNTGFAFSWARQRVADARPFATTADQAYALARIRHGDRVCRADQALHGEAYDLLRKIRANRYDVPRVADPLDPITFVHRIHAPTFLACQFTDEQVGGHCPDLAEHFTGTRRAWFTFTNGTHVDSLDPETLARMVDFLELFVAHRRPVLDLDLGHGHRARVGAEALLGLLGGPLLRIEMGIDGATLHGLPADPVEAAPTLAAARRALLATPRVTIGFDSGAAPGNAPGIPLPAFTAGAARYPLPGTTAQSWYLGPGGALAPGPATTGADTFTWRPGAGRATDYPGANTGPGGLWAAEPAYRWRSPVAGRAVAYVTPPLADDTVVVGSGTVSLWVRSTEPAVDLQATVTEVRPDGAEVYVQNGYLRGDASALAPGSTPLQATLSLRRAQLRPLRPDRWTHVTIPLYPEGHVYRAGSRIRVVIGLVGGDQPVWAFARPDASAPARVTVGWSPARPSRITLPVAPGIAVATGLPADCRALRGEPCRRYAPFTNDGS
jgi:uncharacterized protein